MAVLLTTIDNPFNPFTHWDEWKRYDEDKKHFSCSLLARIAVTSDELSREEYDQAIENAIDEIIKYDATCMFAKIHDNKE